MIRLFWPACLRCGPALALLLSALAQPGHSQSPVDSLLRLMTLEEKLGQLNQPAGPGNETGPAARAGTLAEIRAGRIGSFLGVYGAEYTRDLQRVAVRESRLRIPLLFAHDVI